MQHRTKVFDGFFKTIRNELYLDFPKLGITVAGKDKRSCIVCFKNIIEKIVEHEVKFKYQTNPEKDNWVGVIEIGTRYLNNLETKGLFDMKG